MYCFDLWVRQVRQAGIKIMFQYHDEIAFSLKREEENRIRKTLLSCIEEVNKIVKLNIPLGISVDFGENYAAVH